MTMGCTQYQQTYRKMGCFSGSSSTSDSFLLSGIGVCGILQLVESPSSVTCFKEILHFNKFDCQSHR